MKLADHPDRLQLMFAFDNDDAALALSISTELTAVVGRARTQLHCHAV
jgi:hypothetical protein